MIIEKARKEDINELCSLLKVLFSQEAEFTYDETLQKKALNELISNDSLGEIFVVRVNNKIVAMVTLLYTYSTALASKVAILEDMIVNQDYRGKQIAQNLVEYVKNYAKNNGIKRITLLTDYDNFKAHNFYKKCSFEKSSMIPFRLML